jgi:ribose 5-phosphate isomerase B
MLYLGADHKGFELKENLKKYFDEKQIEYKDCGNLEYVADDDYPDFAFLVGENVTHTGSNAMGILICTSGEGMTIAANKVKGIRAALCHNVTSVKLSREHNDANILVLDANHSLENAIEMVETFMNTKASDEERHRRRVSKITNYELGTNYTKGE